MALPELRSWDELDDETRERLDAQYLEELSRWNDSGLTDECVEAYVKYRHERPECAITTYEEGQIRKMLHTMGDPEALPDPVEEEEHLDALEVVGAKRFHLTNAETYGVVMILLTLGALAVWVVTLM